MPASPRRRRIVMTTASLVAVGAVGVLSALYVAGRPSESEPASIHVRELIRLDGSPPSPPETDVVRLSVVDAALGAMFNTPSFAWREPGPLSAWARTLGAEAELLQPDLLVFTDVVLAGERAVGANLIADVAGRAEMHWQLVIPRLDRRFSLWPDADPERWLGRGQVGDLLFSRYPLISWSWEASAPDPGLRDAPQSGRWSAVFRRSDGSECTLVLQHGTGPNTPSTPECMIAIARPATASADVRADDGTFGITLSGDTTALRTVTHARFRDTVPRNSLFVEIRLPASHPDSGDRLDD